LGTAAQNATVPKQDSGDSLEHKMSSLVRESYLVLRKPFFWAPIVLRRPQYFGLMMRWGWLKVSRGSPLSTGLPWITQSALEWMEMYLRPDMKVWEWGSGGSTVFFAGKTASVVSIEHDRPWYEKVRATLDERGVRNCDLRCIEPVPASGGDLDEESLWASGLPRYSHLTFRRYINAINEFPDRHFDLVFIDGRARMGCLHAALEKVSEAGALVLDNSEYPRYQSRLTLPEEWVRTDLDGPGLFNDPTLPSRTTIWRRRGHGSLPG
jgi:hypothetical protein